MDWIQGPHGKGWRGAALALVILGLLAQWPLRLDVTEDQRHSLSSATNDMLSELAGGEDDVLVKCYLEGDFPARYRRLGDEIKSKLRTFARKSNGQVRWQFIDVTGSGDDKTIGETELALYEQGLRFTRIAHREGGATTFQNVWPCAVVTVKGVDYPVQFLRSENMDPDEVMVQNAITQVEFNLGQAIRMGLRNRRPVVGILQGHGCFLPVETADFTNSLSENCRCGRRGTRWLCRCPLRNHRRSAMEATQIRCLGGGWARFHFQRPRQIADRPVPHERGAHDVVD